MKPMMVRLVVAVTFQQQF